MGSDDPIAVIGTGRIGSVLVRAFDRAGRSVLLAGRNAAAADALAASCRHVRVVTMEAAAAQGAFLVLALPPEAYVPLLSRLAHGLAPQAIVVSLTNGVTLPRLEALVRNPVVKLVPTLAQAVQRGNVLIMPGPRARAADVEAVRTIAALIGTPAVVDDADARVASNVAGAGLALVARWAEAFVAANAVHATTLDHDALAAMMAETLGAVSALHAAGHSLRAIVEATATPGGVTEAALATMDAHLTPQVEGIVTTTLRQQAALQERA